MKRDRSTRAKELSVNGTENAYVVVGSSGGAYYTCVVIYHFKELPNDQGDGLDAFDLLLGSEELRFEVFLFFFDVFFLPMRGISDELLVISC